MQICHVLLYLLLITGSKSQCLGEEGIGQNCCNGYHWDQKTKKCIKCAIGFFGYDCSIRCRYPNFGENCQFYCHCTQSLCDAASGCKLQEQLSTLHPSTDSNSSQNTINITPGAIQKLGSKPSHNIYIIISIACAGAAIIIFPAVCLIYKVTTFRMRMRIVQIEQQRGNVVYGLSEVVSLEHMNRNEFVRTDNQSLSQRSDRHEYLEILGTSDLKYSGESDKRDDEYLTPLQIV